MTQQEQYLAQNALGFEGDGILKQTISDLIKSEGIQVVIETGTFLGNTTVQFAKMVKNVFTIEINPEYYHESARNIQSQDGESTVHMTLGSSAIMLTENIYQAKDLGSILFFLDAHWKDYNPLLVELAIIHRSGLKPVIVIHDFLVPGKCLGYDSYNGQDYDLAWIQPSIERIYGNNGYEYWYNSEATGAKRGVIFIKAKK